MRAATGASEIVAVGGCALYNNTGGSNTAVGWQGLYNNTSGNNNTVLGNAAMYTNTTGACNTAMGVRALNLILLVVVTLRLVCVHYTTIHQELAMSQLVLLR